MASDLLGRTNHAFPKVWYSLRLPRNSIAEDSSVSTIRGAIESGTVIDISSSPAFWGGMARGTDAMIMVRGGTDIERAPHELLACELVQAHLVQTLSAIGRQWIDIYFLQVRGDLMDCQIDGALLALENARQEGHIRHLGIECVGDSIEIQRLWQRRDAFEVALLNSAEPGLISMARERRVGIVTTFPSEYTVLQPLVAAPAAGASR